MVQRTAIPMELGDEEIFCVLEQADYQSLVDELRYLSRVRLCALELLEVLDDEDSYSEIVALRDAVYDKRLQ